MTRTLDDFPGDRCSQAMEALYYLRRLGLFDFRLSTSSQTLLDLQHTGHVHIEPQSYRGFRHLRVRLIGGQHR